MKVARGAPPIGGRQKASTQLKQKQTREII